MQTINFRQVASLSHSPKMGTITLEKKVKNQVSPMMKIPIAYLNFSIKEKKCKVLPSKLSPFLRTIPTKQVGV